MGFRYILCIQSYWYGLRQYLYIMYCLFYTVYILHCIIKAIVLYCCLFFIVLFSPSYYCSLHIADYSVLFLWCIDYLCYRSCFWYKEQKAISTTYLCCYCCCCLCYSILGAASISITCWYCYCCYYLNCSILGSTAIDIAWSHHCGYCCLRCSLLEIAAIGTALCITTILFASRFAVAELACFLLLLC